MSVASLTFHHRTNAGLVSGRSKSMAATFSSLQDILCASGHSIRTQIPPGLSFQTLLTCFFVAQNWSRVASASIAIRITLPHWKLLTCRLIHSRPTWNHSVTACLHMADLPLALNACSCSYLVLLTSD